jgi:hypothetical protein
VSPFAYLERGRYATYLAPWVDVFGPRVRVVFLQELLSSTKMLLELFEGLDVDPGLSSVDAGRPVNASLEPAPELPTQLVGQLREYYETSDRSLAERLQRDLPWRTDEAR